MRGCIERGESFVVDLLNYSHAGEPYWIKLSVVPRRDDAGEVIGFFGLEVDITAQRETQMELEQQRARMELVAFKAARQKRELERLSAERAQAMTRLETEIERSRRLEAELRRQATQDELCGVTNRRGFLERLERELHRADQLGHALGLLTFDLDHFKQVNDTHGHAVGDALLHDVAEACASRIRPDVDLLARVGGEEFVVLVPDTEPKALRALAEALRACIEGVCVTDAPALRPSASIGCALRRRGESGTSLWKRADASLYRAKDGGRNRVVCDGLELAA